MGRNIFVIQINSHTHSRKNRLSQMYLYFESKCANTDTPLNFVLDRDQVPFAQYSCQ